MRPAGWVCFKWIAAHSTCVFASSTGRAGTVWKDEGNPLSTAVTEELDDNLTDASLSTAARHGGADGKGLGRTAIGWLA